MPQWTRCSFTSHDVRVSITRYVPIAEVVRNDFVESIHFGALVILNADGTVRESHGDVHAPILSRSAMKLAQASAMLPLIKQSLTSQQIALIAASHSGEDFHTAEVATLLAKVHLDVTALQCTPKWPFYQPERVHQPQAMYADCSGKHAGMLIACVDQGWSTDNYLDAEHPLQTHIKNEVQRLAGEEVSHTAVDGCGAPVYATSLVGLARMYSRAKSDEGSAHIVAEAMTAHPEFVGGTDRDVTKLMQALPGLTAKEGAEGVFAAALPDGRALALKTADGAMRAWSVVGAAALRHMTGGHEFDELATAPVLGGGKPVGHIHSLLHRF